VLLAHIRAEFESSHYSYGRPRMVEELKAKGLAVGHTRIGRLMRENGIQAIRSRRKRTQRPGLAPSFGYAPNLLDQDFTADNLMNTGPMRNGSLTSPMSPPCVAGFIWL